MWYLGQRVQPNSPISTQQPADNAPLTKVQKRAFLAAFLGWCFDGLDGYLYVMVAVPFVTQLLERDYGAGLVPGAAVKEKAALIQAVFLIGWAIGGAVFGRLGDRLGRARTLTLTVLTYATFTGLSFFATAWWHLLIFRFIAALGIGGEWAAGSALISETMPARYRTVASAALQSGYMIGCILACLTPWVMPPGAERYVFLVGVLPAFLTLWIRWAVPEPEGWKHACATEATPTIGSLFRGPLAAVTLITTALASVALTTVWAFLFFAPQLAGELAKAEPGSTPQSVTNYKTWVTIAYFVANIAANFFATWLAARIGYRRAFFFMMLASLVVFTIGFGGAKFGVPLTTTTAPVVFCLAAFCSVGLFGMFPMYIPRLYPTLVRTLGAGFTYNVGRVVSAAGAYYGGVIAAGVGYDGAIFWTGLLYVAGMLICPFLPLPPEDADAPQTGR